MMADPFCLALFSATAFVARIQLLRGCLENIEGLNAYGFGPDDLRAIERENALRILPQLRR
jgi:hypothetical protein